MANGLRVDLPASLLLSQRDLPLDNILLRYAQAVGHSG
jgi:hypothetical protein